MRRSNQNNTNKMLVKWLAATLVLTLGLFLFTACGSKTEDEKNTGSQTTASEEQQSNKDTATKEENADKNQTETKTTTDTTNDRSSASNDSDAGSTKTDSAAKETTTSTDTSVAATCTIQINCSLLVGQNLTGTGLETLVPSSGVIMNTTKITLQPGDTVYDVTLRAVKSKKIQMSTQGSAAMGTLYVEAISNIYEKAFNAKSGWIYLVNGKKPSVSCGIEKIKANDKLVWAYSLNLGNDL